MIQYRTSYPREQLEEWVDYLVQKYPAAFFRDPALKPPLKKDIIDDLDEPAIDLVATITFYTRDWYYQAALQAGAERVDLNGKKAGKVTEQEARAAIRQVADEKAQRKARQRDPIATANSLHARGRISTDQLSKIDAPQRVFQGVSMSQKSTSDLLARLHSILANADGVLTTGNDKGLQHALAITSLKILIDEAQKVIATLEKEDAL